MKTVFLIPCAVFFYFLTALTGTAHASPLPPSTEFNFDVLYRREFHAVSPASGGLALRGPSPNRTPTMKERWEATIESAVAKLEHADQNHHLIDFDVTDTVNTLLQAEQELHGSYSDVGHMLLQHNESAVKALMGIAQKSGVQYYYPLVTKIHSNQLELAQSKSGSGNVGLEIKTLHTAIKDAKASEESLKKVLDPKNISVITTLEGKIKEAEEAEAQRLLQSGRS